MGIPSHLDSKLLSDPFEDWVQLWNDRVNRAVGLYNWNRPGDLLRLRSDALSRHMQHVM